jgi:hypothetical protein
MQSQANHKRYLIDVSKSWHVAWWAKELGVSENTLLDAIHRVGVEAEAVKGYLMSKPETPLAPSEPQNRTAPLRPPSAAPRGSPPTRTQRA